ncbi:hypothetical protein BDY24DRAFT_402109 [Mrakia frigida]|uniref:uncharacterized protein n=1 Tax=Mrakia frigida TaxID=29902 RepID=UPI003FCBFC2A
MPITVHSNLSLYAVPTAYALAFLPHTIKLIWGGINGIKYNNLNPRAAADHSTLDIETKKVAKKCENLKAIHSNGLEIFPLFATAIIIGNFARLPAKYLNSFAALFLTSRVVFSAIYFLQASQTAAAARSGAFFVGMGASLVVLFQSANKVFSLSA